MDPVGEFKILFQKIAKKSARDDSISIQNICDHLNEVGMIKNGDGSLQDCHKALIHYDKLLVKQKFLVEPGRFTENEFVRFWFNCHVFFNSYDLTNSGQVTKDEFLTKMNDLNSNLDETDKIQDVFRQVDRDGDGEISFMEFFTKLPTIMGAFEN